MQERIAQVAATPGTGIQVTGTPGTGTPGTGIPGTGTPGTGIQVTATPGTGIQVTGINLLSTLDALILKNRKSCYSISLLIGLITIGYAARQDVYLAKNIVEWIYSKDMTDEEKAEHPTHETTGGYLKVLDESECAQVWWNDLTDYDKNIIKSIPNFDADIFERCTGIRI